MNQIVPAIVLAAGLSSRMGQFKPLLPLGGVPLITHVIQALTGCGRIAPLVVVTGHRGAELTAALPAEVVAIANPDFAAGEMLSSLKVGLTEVEKRMPDALGFVLAFADQPAVLSQTVEQLVRGFLAAQAPLALPVFAGRRGHPIVISKALIPEIRALGGMQTLRDVVHRHLPQAALVPVEDPAVLEDLDTADDFARAQARYAQKPC